MILKPAPSTSRSRLESCGHLRGPIMHQCIKFRHKHSGVFWRIFMCTTRISGGGYTLLFGDDWTELYRTAERRIVTVAFFAPCTNIFTYLLIYIKFGADISSSSARPGCFGFPMRCFVSKPERVKWDLEHRGQMSDFVTFSKLREGWAKCLICP